MPLGQIFLGSSALTGEHVTEPFVSWQQVPALQEANVLTLQALGEGPLAYEQGALLSLLGSFLGYPLKYVPD